MFLSNESTEWTNLSLFEFTPPLSYILLAVKLSFKDGADLLVSKCELKRVPRNVTINRDKNRGRKEGLFCFDLVPVFQCQDNSMG